MSISLKCKKVLNSIKENPAISLLVPVMTVIYIIRMFTNGPWYDELYTYYYFISRGPVYAAIHWPVPNNHVGYSVLSGFLDYLGNPYIGLRGVSCIAAVANLILIYRLCRRFLTKNLSAAVAALYSASYLVHLLAVQGRGYTIAITYLLVAAISALNICLGEYGRKDFVLFAVSLMLGLYTLPSSLYWVMPICITGGLFLLFAKEYKRLLQLFLSGVCAAVGTLFLYMLIWLAIGANLLSKDAESAYFGMNQAKVVLKAPLASARTGIEYMTATPYIQSIDRMECIKGLFRYFKDLSNNFYDRLGLPVLIIAAVVLVVSIVAVIRNAGKKNALYFASLFVSVFMITVPLMLIIQSVHPYKRVLSFLVLPLTVGLGITVNMCLEMIKKDKLKGRIGIGFAALAFVFLFISMINPYYRAPMAERENDLKAVFDTVDVNSIDSIYYTDDFQKYVLKFYYGVTPTEMYTLDEANYVVIGPEQRDESYAAPVWPVLYPYSEGLIEDVSKKMVVIGSTDNYTIYAK